MKFTDFNLREELIKALDDLEYIKPTTIQEKTIPSILEGKDLLGIAHTGTGKTAAFALPILNSFLEQKKESRSKYPRALILAPTRELCAQIKENLNFYSKYTKIKSIVTYGGVAHEPQIEALQEKQDILVATPGRLLNLLKEKNVFLDDIEFFVLDEADNLIEMGLQADLKNIMKKISRKRQNLFFSATMNKEIKLIANELLNNPVKAEIEAEEIDIKLIQQNVQFMLKENKIKSLLNLLNRKEVKYVILFANSRSVVDDLIRSLTKNNIKAEALHSGKSNVHREKVIRHIKFKETKIVVATDLASRGLDLQDMTHVINFEIPKDFETYVHRIGRIGRMGKQGAAFSLCSLHERKKFKEIEKQNKYPLKIDMHEFHSNLVKTDGGNKDKATHHKARPKKKGSTYSNRKGKR
ncbi:MAG: DEAD/DEAH box helicase [Candidatus Woesearchaeota archaeon]|jgi:ATP-dependent RNA helicase RhlE|nr:DEAD/DEAH box helicase [Candidatus Woesearchaeota archaeon]